MISHEASARVRLDYSGPNFFRLRLVLAIISGRPVFIRDIRSFKEEPGLKQFEIKLIKLLDHVSNGLKVTINETGTELYFEPGILVGGNIEFDCGEDRGIGYFLEALIYLCPFMKTALNIVLHGITNFYNDISVDIIKAAWLPLLKKFILNDENLDIKIVRRGIAPDGGGEVVFYALPCKQLRSITLLKQGKVKKIRGVAWACKVSPLLANRMIDAAKKQCQQFLTDIYIYSDHRKGVFGGRSPGFGIVLFAETTEGVTFAAEVQSKTKADMKSNVMPSVPEDLGVEVARRLFDEIYRGGCVDSSAQSLVILFMSLGQKDVSKVICGPLSQYSLYCLRHVNDCLNVVFKLETVLSNSGHEFSLGCDKVQLICVGAGYSNLSKPML